MSLQYLKFVLILTITAKIAHAQIGNYCENDNQCIDEQICITKHCNCKVNYIPNGIYCFQEARFGEVCWFADHCNDHRLICANTSVGIQRCICDMYHQYDFNTSNCVLKPNLIDLLQERYDIQGQIGEGSTSTFYGILVAGLFITGVGCCCMVAAFLYCFRIHLSDKKLDKEVTLLTKKLGKKPGPSVKQTSEDTKRLNDAAIDNVFSDDIDI